MFLDLYLTNLGFFWLQLREGLGISLLFFEEDVNRRAIVKKVYNLHTY